MLGNYALTSNKQSLKRSELMAKATFYSGMVSGLLKATIREPRPYDCSVRNSFPSGHSTTAFAFSSLIVAEHGFFPYGFLATTMATITAASRINDNKHYLHDVVAGATIGTAYGLGLSYLYQNDSEKSHEESKKIVERLQIYPVFDSDTKGLMLSIRF